jgi:hypothetical protein
MILTLGIARQHLHRFIDDGVPPDDPRIPARIWEVTERLLNEGEWRDSTRLMRVCARSGCIALPREVDHVVKVAIEGQPSYVWSRWYEFLESGPGPQDSCWRGCADGLIDRGEHPVFRDIEGNFNILVQAEQPEAAGAKILLRGIDETNREVFAVPNGDVTLPGQYVNIERSNPKYSTVRFRRITSVVKPKTKGYVYLYAYKPVTDPLTEVQSMYLLAQYHPLDETPSFRWYMVNGIGPEPREILLMVKISALPPVHDSDPLTIQSLGALKRMLQGLRAEDANDEGGAAIKRASALQIMSKRDQIGDGTENEIQMQDNWGTSGFRGVM